MLPPISLAYIGSSKLGLTQFQMSQIKINTVPVNSIFNSTKLNNKFSQLLQVNTYG